MKTIKFSFSLAVLLVGFPGSLFSQGGLDQRVADLSQQIAKEMTEYQKTTIAVIEFSDLQGNVTDFGRFLAEELITRLYQAKKFKVIERQLLNKIITEQKLSLTGMVDPTSAKELGKLLGVDAIASGTISDLAQSLRVNARLISTETGEIFAVASVEIFKDESVTKLMAAGVATPTPGTKPPIRLTVGGKIPVEEIEAKGFIFRLEECKMSGTSVSCKILITNNENDRNLSIYTKSYSGSSRIFDDSGNEYTATQVQIGNQFGSAATAMLVSGIPIKAQLNFEKVLQQASTLTLLEINCYHTDLSALNSFGVQFRDIPITK